MTRAYSSGPSATPLLGTTVGDSLRIAAERWGDAEALVSRHQNVRLSWNELSDQADDVARALLALGIERGDRVGIWSPTCVEWTLLQFATARVGAILVNVNPAYRPSELAYALGHSGVRLLVSAIRFKTSEYLAMIAEVRDQLPALERVVAVGDERPGGADDLVWSELVALGADVPLTA